MENCVGSIPRKLQISGISALGRSYQFMSSHRILYVPGPQLCSLDLLCHSCSPWSIPGAYVHSRDPDMPGSFFQDSISRVINSYESACITIPEPPSALPVFIFRVPTIMSWASLWAESFIVFWVSVGGSHIWCGSFVDYFPSIHHIFIPVQPHNACTHVRSKLPRISPRAPLAPSWDAISCVCPLSTSLSTGRSSCLVRRVWNSSDDPASGPSARSGLCFCEKLHLFHARNSEIIHKYSLSFRLTVGFYFP